MVKLEQHRLDTIFHALSDATRRAILRDIAKKERTVGEIAKPYDMSLAAVSKHLKVLESADLITREKRGSFQIVHIKVRTLKSAERWLAYYQKFWTERLDALEAFLNEAEPTEHPPKRRRPR